MGINRVKYRGGSPKVEVRRRWPDGREFRRFFPNRRKAEEVYARIIGSIADGSWRKVREELSRTITTDPTVEEFSVVFLERYAKPRLRSWKRYELSFKSLNARLGGILVKDFDRRYLHAYVQKRVREVAPNTVNKDIAAIKKLFSFALEEGLIDHHPLTRFPTLKTQEHCRPVLSVADFRKLVAAMDRTEVAVMVALMGETGIRKGEALTLKWENVHLREKVLTVEERTKNRKVRHIPLSPFALASIQRLVRHVKIPWLFVDPLSGRRRFNPEKAFRRGAEAAKLEWVGFHDLRRYRATHWLREGVDVRTVKEMLGHQDLKTTLRYAQFVSDHAVQSIRAAQAAEQLELSQTAGEEPKRVTTG